MHVHIVFGVKYRRALLAPAWRHEVFAYISKTIEAEGHKPLAVNGVTDHIHLALGMRPVQAACELVQRVKQSSSRWINDAGLTAGKFAWQEGYAVIGFSKSHLPPVLEYIAGQEAHHQTISFRDEYHHLLRVNGIEFEEKYTFHDPE